MLNFADTTTSICWNEREHFLSLPEVIDALTSNGFAIEKAVELNRTGSYCCYRARNLKIR